MSNLATSQLSSKRSVANKRVQIQDIGACVLLKSSGGLLIGGSCMAGGVE